MEALPAGALDPAPPPLQALVEPGLLPEVPADAASLPDLLPRADLYLRDEVQFAPHPTLTRLWCRRGRRGQRLVAAPGANQQLWGFGLVDWRDGWFDGRLEAGRTAAGFCARVRAAVARPRARGRAAIVLADNAGTRTPAGSLLVRAMAAELADEPRLVYTPPYDPDANRIEWLWRVSRRAVTPNHQHADFAALRAAAEAHFADLAAHPAAVLAHLGRPGLATEDDHDALPLAA